jgi:predicted nuclease of predicted toxin-antitoxin system
MKLLLDENLPVKLKYRFLENGIDAFTTRDMNWLGKENGNLLKEMLSNNFTAFITYYNRQ